MIKFLGAVKDILESNAKLDNRALEFLNRPRYRLFINPTPRFSAALYFPWRLYSDGDLNDYAMELTKCLWGGVSGQKFLAVDHKGKIYVAESVNEPCKKSPDVDLLLNDQSLWKRRNPRVWRLAAERETAILDGIKHLVSGYNACRTWEMFKATKIDCSKSLRDDVIEFENRQFDVGMKAFCNYQAGNIWGFMRRYRIPQEMKTYNWLLEHHGEIKKRRKQAAKAYPFLALELSGFVNQGKNFKYLSETVDQAGPLLPALCETFDVKKSTLKKLARLGALQRKSFFSQVERAGDILSALDAIEHKYWPERQKEWDCFAFMLSEIPDVWRIHNHEVNQNLYKKRVRQHLRRMSIKGWVSAKKYRNNLANYSLGLISIREVICCMNRIFPESYQGLEALVNKISDWDMKTWYEVVEAWHQGVLKYEAKNATNNNLSWPALVSDREVGGFYFKVLTSPTELANEGREMQHCVATCVNGCLFTGNHIISQLNESGERCCTLEVQIKKNSGEDGAVEIIQHYGVRNKQPTSREKRAVNKWVAWVNSEADFELLVQVNNERNSRRAEIMDELDGSDVERDRFALEYACLIMDSV